MNSAPAAFIRSALMILALIVIFLIAVFWNGLPEKMNLPLSWKQFFQQDEEEKEPQSKPKSDSNEPEKSEPTPIHENPISQDETETLVVSPTESVTEPELEPVFPPEANLEPETIAEENLPEEYKTLKETLEQEFNATEFRVEPWGSEGNLYRFSCYITDPPGSGVKKLRQAIQPTPTEAIQKVLDELR